MLRQAQAKASRSWRRSAAAAARSSRWPASQKAGTSPVASGYGGRQAAKAALDRLVERKKEGTATAVRGLTVEKAIRDWLRHGLNGRTAATVEKLTILAETHIVASLGARLLLNPKQSKELTADDVDAWLEEVGRGSRHAHAPGPPFDSPARHQPSGEADKGHPERGAAV